MADPEYIRKRNKLLEIEKEIERLSAEKIKMQKLERVIEEQNIELRQLEYTLNELEVHNASLMQDINAMEEAIKQLAGKMDETATDSSTLAANN